MPVLIVDTDTMPDRIIGKLDFEEAHRSNIPVKDVEAVDGHTRSFCGVSLAITTILEASR